MSPTACLRWTTLLWSGNLYGSSNGDVACIHGSRWACGNIFELKSGQRSGASVLGWSARRVFKGCHAQIGIHQEKCCPRLVRCIIGNKFLREVGNEFQPDNYPPCILACFNRIG
jgi:hypothetical protein